MFWEKCRSFLPGTGGLGGGEGGDSDLRRNAGHGAGEIGEKKVSIHFWAPNLVSGGPSEYLIGEVRLEFGGWLGLDINFLGLVHRFAIIETL